MTERSDKAVKPAAFACARALLAAVILLRAPLAEARSYFHPDLVEAELALEGARGPEVYTALRRIWAVSSRADPAHVEASLLRASASPRLTAPARAYAELLVAYARSRRGDLAGAQSRIRRLGFVNQWWIVGPFDNEGKVGFENVFEPETPDALSAAIVPGRAFSGKERAVRWRSVPASAFSYGWLDAGSLLRPEEKVCFFATTFLKSKKSDARSRKISLWVGASGAFKLFWNGTEVLRDAAYRGFDSDRMAAPVMLEPGTNRAVLKVCGDEESPVVSLRVADAQGAPDPDIEVSATLADSQQPPVESKPIAGGPYGPLQ